MPATFRAISQSPSAFFFFQQEVTKHFGVL